MLQITNPWGVPNQQVVSTQVGQIFVSYGSKIVFTSLVKGKPTVCLDKNFYKASKTTIKYRNLFLGETTKEVEAKIKSGEYKLIEIDQS